MVFWRRNNPLDLTSDAHARWLRAGRPPYGTFLALSEMEQEALARIGDDFREDFILSIGYAVQNPSAADEGIAASNGDLSAEVGLARKLAEGLVHKLEGTQQAQQPKTVTIAKPKPATFSGLSDRRDETLTDKSQRDRPSLFGVVAE